MALAHQETIWYQTSTPELTGHYFANKSNEAFNFKYNDHSWTFVASMVAASGCYCERFKLKCIKETLNMTLTYNGTSAESKQEVEVFGRIGFVKEDCSMSSIFYRIPRTAVGPDKRSFHIEQNETNRLILPLVVDKILRIRVQLYFVRNAYIPTDYKVLKPYASAVVHVGETKFYVSKEILASLSPVFSSMFFEEKNETNEITLSDVTSDDFEGLLNAVQPGSRMEPSRAIVSGFLELARKYRMPSVAAICENGLISFCNGKMPVDERKKYFALACELGMLRLQHKFIMTIPLKELPNLLDDSAVDAKSKDVATMVIDRMISEHRAPRKTKFDRPSEAFDFKTQKPYANLTISVNDTKLYASRELLASASSVFAAMFFGNFEESKKNEITVEEVELLLGFLQPGSRTTVNGQNVMRLLKLANKYLIESVITVCDDFLAADYLGEEHPITPSNQCLAIAAEYNLGCLASVFVSNCHPSELRKLFDNGQIDSFSADVARMVADRLWSSAGTGLKAWSDRAAAKSS